MATALGEVEPNGSVQTGNPASRGNLEDAPQYDVYGFFVGGGESVQGSGHGAVRAGSSKNRHKEWDKFMEQFADTGQVTRSRELKLLVREGVPGTFRRKLWPCLAGTAELREKYPPHHYEELLQCVSQGTEMRHEVHLAIENDVRRTFPGHLMFATQDGLAALQRVLAAYSIHCPAVGYCQSLNFIVAMMLLFLDEEEAFWLLDTILQRILAANYYTPDMRGFMTGQECLRQLVNERLRDLLQRTSLLEADWEVVTCKWFLCIFVNCLPLETTLRVWDVFFHEGEEALFRVALAIFKLFQDACVQYEGGDEAMGEGRALAALQNFASKCHDVDTLFQAAFSDPRCACCGVEDRVGVEGADLMTKLEFASVFACTPLTAPLARNERKHVLCWHVK